MELLGLFLIGIILGVIFGISMCKFWEDMDDE